MRTLLLGLGFCLVAHGQQFINVTQSSGLFSPGIGGLFPQPGAAWGDYDGDGTMDLFAPGGSTQPVRLYLNQGGGTYLMSVIEPGVVGRVDNACISADVDNDGDQDVFLCRYANEPCRLWINDGTGQFSEEAALRGLDFQGNAMCASFGDLDRDGDLDLLLSEYDLPSEHHVFANDGAGNFSDVTPQLSLNANPALTFAAMICDTDDDQWPDIVITTMGDGPTQILRNNADGTFTDRAPALNADPNILGMGITIGDLGNDGDWDLFITNVNLHLLLEWDTAAGSYRFINTHWGVAQSYGALGGFAWGCEFLDYDNDGLL
ncbi:MAG: VCBS repeat-containing protein, partial [Planctomycetes bacterium]|nr:VCBS repeat-containing protein [Planctomycetota bacterium]